MISTVALAAAMASGQAAACDGCVVEAVGRLTGATKNGFVALSSLISQRASDVMASMKGATASQSMTIASSADAISAANQDILKRHEQTRQTGRYETSDPCNVSAASMGTGPASVNMSAGGTIGRGGAGGGRGGYATASNAMQSALSIAKGVDAAPTPEIQASISARGACETFASNGLRRNMCSAAGYTPGQSSPFVDADIRAETIFDGPQKSVAQTVTSRTIPPGDSPERTAIEAYVRNLETPLDLRALKPGEITNEAGRAYMSQRDTYEARMSMAMKSMRDQVARITANQQTIPVLKQLAAGGDAQFVNKYLSQRYPNWQSEGVSIAELMKLEAERRYLNFDWHLRMSAASPDAVKREHAEVMAFQAWLQVQKLEEDQRGLMLAGLTAQSKFRRELMPDLVASHKLARR